MALNSLEWQRLLEEAVRIEGAPIWLPIGELRRLDDRLWEVTFEPRMLRQGPNQGDQVQFDENLEGARVVCRQRGGGPQLWRGSVVTVLPGEGVFTLRLQQGRIPEHEPVFIYPPSYLDDLLDQVLQWTAQLPPSLDTLIEDRLQRVSQRRVPWPQVSVGAEPRVRQAEALELVGSPLAVVWGPPGTGKTATLAAAVTRLALAGERVLVTAPTRVAADGACLAIDRALTQAGLARERGDLLRTALPQRALRFREQNPDLLLWADEERVHRDRLVALQSADEEGRRQLLTEAGAGYDQALIAAAAYRSSLDALERSWKERARALVAGARVVVATVRQAQVKAWPAGFAHVIVDEGSMVPVSDGMALLIQQELGQRDGSLLVFGDPKQLPPIGLRVDALDDEDAEGGAQAMVEELRRLNGLWLETSFQGRLMERHPERLSMVMLNEQSRMNPTLCGVVSAEQYEGELVPTATAPAPGVPPWLTGGICVLHPLEPPAWLRPALHERPGPRRPRHAGGSRYQVQVARASIALARHLAGRGIGVLLCSPYRAQAGLLRRGVADLPHVRAGTVHRVQGEEADVAIFDPAMAGSYFIRHSPIAARLVNVAASRARRALVLCNAPVYLRQNPLLSPFVDAATTL